MPVETFIDINEKQQCQELREYMLELGASIPATATDSYMTDLQQIISVCDIIFKLEESENLELVLNSIISVLLQVDGSQPEASALVTAFCDQMAKAPTQKHAGIAFRACQNLFNGLSHFIQLRYRVFLTMMKVAPVAGSVRQVSNLQYIKKCFPMELIGAEKFQAILRLLHQLLVDSKQPEMASKIMIELLTTYSEETASQARDDAHKCIVSAMADPYNFLMDGLLTLKPVKFLEGELVHDLLSIFVTETLSTYMKFYKTNGNYITESLGLSHEANMQKMRLLTFMQMAETKKEIAYADIERELQLKPEQVEFFIIDVLKTKLVKAHIDQLNRKVVVSCTIHRTFGRPQWQQLRETLLKTSANLSQVQTVLVQHMKA